MQSLNQKKVPAFAKSACPLAGPAKAADRRQRREFQSVQISECGNVLWASGARRELDFFVLVCHLCRNTSVRISATTYILV
jgi:hypothetical protein